MMLGASANEAHVKVIEECGEIIQAACKAVQHGPWSYNPDRPQDGSNQVMLAKEIGDLMGLVSYMVVNGMLDPALIQFHATTKIDRMKPFTHEMHIPPGYVHQPMTF